MWLPLRYVFNICWYWTLFLHWLNLELMGIPFKFHLESFWNLGGNSMEIPLEFHWESVGIILEFPWNFPGIPLGIHGNPQEWHIPTIPADSQWNSNIPWDSGGIHRNSWRRVKYWQQHPQQQHPRPGDNDHTNTSTPNSSHNNPTFQTHEQWPHHPPASGPYWASLVMPMNDLSCPHTSHPTHFKQYLSLPHLFLLDSGSPVGFLLDSNKISKKAFSHIYSFPWTGLLLDSYWTLTELKQLSQTESNGSDTGFLLEYHYYWHDISYHFDQLTLSINI